MVLLSRWLKRYTHHQFEQNNTRNRKQLESVYCTEEKAFRDIITVRKINREMMFIFPHGKESIIGEEGRPSSCPSLSLTLRWLISVSRAEVTNKWQLQKIFCFQKRILSFYLFQTNDTSWSKSPCLAGFAHWWKHPLFFSIIITWSLWTTNWWNLRDLALANKIRILALQLMLMLVFWCWRCWPWCCHWLEMWNACSFFSKR